MVTLSGADSATPSFTAPEVSMDTPFTFELEVTDSGGLSATDTVVVTVLDTSGDPGPDPDPTPDPGALAGNNKVGALSPLALLLLGLAAARRRRRR